MDSGTPSVSPAFSEFVDPSETVCFTEVVYIRYIVKVTQSLTHTQSHLFQDFILHVLMARRAKGSLHSYLWGLPISWNSVWTPYLGIGDLIAWPPLLLLSSNQASKLCWVASGLYWLLSLAVLLLGNQILSHNEASRSRNLSYNVWAVWLVSPGPVISAKENVPLHPHGKGMQMKSSSGPWDGDYFGLPECI
jgi:hypothetical protein